MSNQCNVPNFLCLVLIHMGNSASDKSNVIARSTPERAKRAEGCDEAISDLLEDYELQRVTRNDAQPTDVRDYTITAT